MKRPVYLCTNFEQYTFKTSSMVRTRYAVLTVLVDTISTSLSKRSHTAKRLYT